MSELKAEGLSVVCDDSKLAMRVMKRGLFALSPASRNPSPFSLHTVSSSLVTNSKWRMGSTGSYTLGKCAASCGSVTSGAES